MRVQHGGFLITRPLGEREIKETPVFNANRLKQKEALESASRIVAAKALIQVEKKIENASAYQPAGIYGLLRTHERLDAGEPTQIAAFVSTQAVETLVTERFSPI
jgi:hypothetical protein